MNPRNYFEILRKELVPALGCTEPIAIAYAAACATRELGQRPERVVAKCSANIVKNVMSVVVPNSGGMKGIEAAAVLGAFFGNPEKKLEVLAKIPPDQAAEARNIILSGLCAVELLEGDEPLYVIVRVSAGSHSAEVHLKGGHTNIVTILKDDAVTFAMEQAAGPAEANPFANNEHELKNIVEFALTCDYAEVRDLLDAQISCNMNIAEEGLHKAYGARVGKTLLGDGAGEVRTKAKAMAAAASDARMSGCDLPVVINSGSGNQGITASLPVVEYAKSLGVDDERLYRALILSNLVALYQKSYIGKLSAYCGVVSAACGSGAAITYLKGGSYEQISDTVTNTLATASGIVCDGAKASCAAKIATAVDAAILGHEMAMNDSVFSSGDGIVKDNPDTTIAMVGALAHGMKETDRTILNIMLNKAGKNL